MKKKSKKILFIIVSMLLILSGCSKNENKEKEKTNNDKPVVAEKKLKIIDEESNTRPYAVMINNIAVARKYQSGLDDAYIVYEMIVEGGITRLLALYKDANVDRIGSVRSSRHYYLDYALENDAIYVHFGWSPQAEADISELGVDNINGLYYDGTYFWRVSDKYAPHNAVISTKNILQIAKNNEYRTTTDQKPVLNYVADEVELETDKNADTVIIPYSDYNTVKYIYDEETKEYTRYSKGEKQVDWDTDTTVTTKNIIITFAQNYNLNDGSGKGRQGLDNIGKLEGYYITNGKAIEITCEKTSRTAQTVYKDLQGNEIKVNDGKTFIQICPINAKVTIEGENKTTEE